MILQYNDVQDVACTTYASSKLMIMGMSQVASLTLMSQIKTGINLEANASIPGCEMGGF